MSLTTLGKRKRRAAVEESEDAVNDRETQKAAAERLRAHFESIYEPLDIPPQPNVHDDESLQENDVSDDFEGFDEDDDIEIDEIEAHEIEARETNGHAAAEVIDYSGPATSQDGIDSIRELRRAFMSAKPPPNATSVSSSPKPVRKPAPVDEDDTENLKNDLALQRLLSESHILQGGKADSLDSSAMSGLIRQQAHEHRLSSLGAKTSLFVQKNMPRAARIGIEKKKVEKEKARRAQARDAGIILEKPAAKSRERKRADADVGRPSIGRMKGGTLKLSRKDVHGLVDGRGGGGSRRGSTRGRGGKRR